MGGIEQCGGQQYGGQQSGGQQYRVHIQCYNDEGVHQHLRGPVRVERWQAEDDLTVVRAAGVVAEGELATASGAARQQAAIDAMAAVAKQLQTTAVQERSARVELHGAPAVHSVATSTGSAKRVRGVIGSPGAAGAAHADDSYDAILVGDEPDDVDEPWQQDSDDADIVDPCRPRARSSCGSALHDAAKSGNVKVLEQLLCQRADPDSKVASCSIMPLSLAVTFAPAAVLHATRAILLAHGATELPEDVRHYRVRGGSGAVEKERQWYRKAHCLDQPGPVPGLPDRSSVRQPKVAKLVAEHGTRASAAAVAAPCKSCSVDADESREKEGHRGSREEDAWLNVTGATHDNPSFGLGRSARMKFSRRRLSASVLSECKQLLQKFIGERVSALQIRQLLSILPAGYDHELGIETGLLGEACEAKDVASYVLLVDYRRRIADLVSCCTPVRDAKRVVLKLIEPIWASDVAAGNKFFECVANKTHWGNAFKGLTAGDLFIVAHRGTFQVAAIGEIASTPRTKVSDRAVLYAMLLPERRAAIDAYLVDAATFDFVQFRKVHRPPQLLEARDMLRRVGAAAPAQWQGVLHISTDEDVHTRLGELVESWPSHDNQM